MQLADLATRIAANDAVIERVNRKLPHGANWLASAEAIARGLRGFVDGPTYIPASPSRCACQPFGTPGVCRTLGRLTGCKDNP